VMVMAVTRPRGGERLAGQHSGIERKNVSGMQEAVSEQMENVVAEVVTICRETSSVERTLRTNDSRSQKESKIV